MLIAKQRNKHQASEDVQKNSHFVKCQGFLKVFSVTVTFKGYV